MSDNKQKPKESEMKNTIKCDMCKLGGEDLERADTNAVVRVILVDPNYEGIINCAQRLDVMSDRYDDHNSFLCADHANIFGIDVDLGRNGDVLYCEPNFDVRNKYSVNAELLATCMGLTAEMEAIRDRLKNLPEIEYNAMTEIINDAKTTIAKAGGKW